MIDIRLIRSNPEFVKENMRKKFQETKLNLVDEVFELDVQLRECKTKADTLRGQRNSVSKEIGKLMGQGKREEAEAMKQQVAEIAAQLEELKHREEVLPEEIRQRMLVIPNIIDESVPLGKDDSENVQIECFGEMAVPDYEIPYHLEMMEQLQDIDLDSAVKTTVPVSLFRRRCCQNPFAVFRMPGIS
jgi:seryl-tRNA synthetase